MCELQASEYVLYDLMKRPEDMGSWYVREIAAEVTEHKGAFLVAEIEDELAGYATLLAEVSSEEDRDEILYTYAYIGDLVVAEAHRGEGVGKALLQACEARALQAGQTMLRLSVLADNSRARRVYAAAGFKEHLITLTKKLT